MKNQLEKEKNKIKKELLKKANKSMKNRTYKFKYVDSHNSEEFEDVIDTVIEEINNDVSINGFVLSYTREEKRSLTTKFALSTVYDISVCIASKTDKLFGKTNKAKARSGEDIEW